MIPRAIIGQPRSSTFEYSPIWHLVRRMDAEVHAWLILGVPDDVEPATYKLPGVDG